MPYPSQQIERLIRHHLGDDAEPRSVRRITTGKFNASFDVALPGREVIARIAPPDDAVFCFYEYRMMRQEPEIHDLLRRRTTVPVAEILAADFSRELIDRDFLIMTRLPGRPMGEGGPLRPSDHAAILRQVGRYLAETHALTADRYGYIGAHQPMPPADSWIDAFTVMWHKLIDDVVGVQGYTAGEADRMRGLFERHRRRFNHPVESRLLHMDIWHENILCDGEGQVVGLVDWDRALWGDPEIEFAVLDYCGISEPPFWEGYGRARPEGESARIRQLLYLLYEMQKYIVIRKGRDGRAAEALAHKQRCLRLADAVP